MAATEPIRSREDVRKLLNYLLERERLRDYLLVVIGIYTALRIGDILSLKWGDVYNFESGKYRGRLRLEEKKTGKSKSIAINSHIAWALARYAAGLSRCVSDTYLFRGNRRENKPICRSQAYRIIRGAAKGAGLEGRVSCHSLRKTFGYHAWRAGTPSVVIMDIYNHSSFDVTRRYLGVCQDDRDSVYMNMDFI